MLERLLNLLHTGGVRRLTDLARELDTTPVLIEAMLERLEQMGYLRRVGGEAEGQTCGETCAGCALAGLCAAAGCGQVWVLTGKGRRNV